MEVILTTQPTFFLSVRFKQIYLFWYPFGHLYESFPNDSQYHWFDHLIWVRKAYQGILITDTDIWDNEIQPWWLHDLPAPDDYDPMPF